MSKGKEMSKLTKGLIGGGLGLTAVGGAGAGGYALGKKKTTTRFNKWNKQENQLVRRQGAMMYHNYLKNKMSKQSELEDMYEFEMMKEAGIADAVKGSYKRIGGQAKNTLKGNRWVKDAVKAHKGKGLTGKELKEAIKADVLLQGSKGFRNDAAKATLKSAAILGGTGLAGAGALGGGGYAGYKALKKQSELEDMYEFEMMKEAASLKGFGAAIKAAPGRAFTGTKSAYKNIGSDIKGNFTGTKNLSKKIKALKAEGMSKADIKTLIRGDVAAQGTARKALAKNVAIVGGTGLAGAGALGGGGYAGYKALKKQSELEDMYEFEMMKEAAMPQFIGRAGNAIKGSWNNIGKQARATLKANKISGKRVSKLKETLKGQELKDAIKGNKVISKYKGARNDYAKKTLKSAAILGGTGLAGAGALGGAGYGGYKGVKALQNR